MRLFLMAGGLAAAALFVACEDTVNERSRPPALPEQPFQPNRNFRTTFNIQHPAQEYQRLCQILFNKRGADCDAIMPSSALREVASASSGLNAYTRGIVSQQNGYDYATAHSRWSGPLQALEGARFYLSGHGGCTWANKDTPNRPCFKINDGSTIPAVYDFEDDYSNVVGAFFFLQSQRALFANPATTCSLGVATLGSDEAPFCQLFTMHNIVLTPIALRLRIAGQVQTQIQAQASCGGTR